jgi:hypothetical protein
MIELLAIPAWDAPPRTLEEWTACLAEAGAAPSVVRESTDVCWVEVGVLRLRGYVVLEGRHVSAINFELVDPDPAPARRLVEEAAWALGWEVHADEDDEEDDDREP